MREIDPIKKHLFLEGVFLKYGYDFREYSEASLDRRLDSLVEKDSGKDILDVLKNALDSPEFFKKIIAGLTINTSDFFRDADFFKLLAAEVFPILATYPSIRIWSAGCSTGQEIISLNILLKEAKLFNKTTVYATDINPKNLADAKKGIFSEASLKDFVKNYVKAGGVKVPSDYYTADYKLVRFDPGLLKNVVFSEHNLATDSVFAEFQLILCRNVLIYFTKNLQKKVFDLFLKSLSYGGFLGIGSKESLNFSSVENQFFPLNSSLNVYRRKISELNSNLGNAR